MPVLHSVGLNSVLIVKVLVDAFNKETALLPALWNLVDSSSDQAPGGKVKSVCDDNMLSPSPVLARAEQFRLLHTQTKHLLNNICCLVCDPLVLV